MKVRFRPRFCFACACLLATGCTSLREIPRSEYAAAPQRQHVRLITREGLIYEFDYIVVNGDSLTGYRRRDTPGVEDYATLPVALDEVQKLSARSIDWVRTGLIGGGVVAALVVKGLGSSGGLLGGGGDGGGGGGGRVP